MRRSFRPDAPTMVIERTVDPLPDVPITRQSSRPITTALRDESAPHLVEITIDAQSDSLMDITNVKPPKRKYAQSMMDVVSRMS